MEFKIWLRIAGFVMPICLACTQAPIKTQEGPKPVQFFNGKEAPLQAAIDADDPVAIEKAVNAGADVNAKGLHGATPAEYAVVRMQKTAFKKLLDLGANPNLRDDSGQNVMTLGVQAYAHYPGYLVEALKAGGNPNTRFNDDDPIMMQFLAEPNPDAIRILKQNGGDIDVMGRNGDPIVITAAMVERWDVAWALLEMGAKFDYPNLPTNMPLAFETPKVTPPDSPLFPYKVKCWKFLKAHGMKLRDLEGAE
jgi:ankyrin repeat protein